MAELIDIKHTISRIRQPSKNSCWATCIAMLSGSSGKPKNIVQDVIKIAKKHGVQINLDDSLMKNPENMAKLASTFKLTIKSANDVVYVPHIVEILNSSPIILFGSFLFEQQAPFFHAVLLYGMYGDGGNKTTVNIVDPLTTSNGDDTTNDYMEPWENLSKCIIRLDFILYKK